MSITSLRVLNNLLDLTGFRWFSKSLCFWALDESSLGIGRVKRGVSVYLPFLTTSKLAMASGTLTPAAMNDNPITVSGMPKVWPENRTTVASTGELGYDGPLYDRLLPMKDNMLGPSPKLIKYVSYAYDGPIFLVPLSPSYPSSPVSSSSAHGLSQQGFWVLFWKPNS